MEGPEAVPVLGATASDRHAFFTGTASLTPRASASGAGGASAAC